MYKYINELKKKKEKKNTYENFLWVGETGIKSFLSVGEMGIGEIDNFFSSYFNGAWC